MLKEICRNTLPDVNVYKRYKQRFWNVTEKAELSIEKQQLILFIIQDKNTPKTLPCVGQQRLFQDPVQDKKQNTHSFLLQEFKLFNKPFQSDKSCLIHLKSSYYLHLSDTKGCQALSTHFICCFPASCLSFRFRHRLLQPKIFALLIHLLLHAGLKGEPTHRRNLLQIMKPYPVQDRFRVQGNIRHPKYPATQKSPCFLCIFKKDKRDK